MVRRAGGATMTIATINPATGEVLKTYDEMAPDGVERRIAAATEGFATLRRTSFAQRAEWMEAAARILEAERDLADEAADAQAVGASAAYVRYQPIGPLLAVMPWNFPLWQVIRFAAPALMAGNTGLLKHASNVPQTALFLEDLFRRAGFPEGAFQTLLVGSDRVEAVLTDRRVRAATLTGSEGAGRSVARIAGAHVKKTVLELGGSDPFVVMPSADIDRAAAVAVTARCQN